MKSPISVLATGILIGMLVSGCDQNGASGAREVKDGAERPAANITSSAPDLTGTWIMTNLGAAEINPAEAPRGLPTLVFDLPKSRYSANTGCNTLRGSFKMDKKGKLHLVKSGLSKMSCKSDMEQQVVSALLSVTGYRQVGDELILESGEYDIAVYTRKK